MQGMSEGYAGNSMPHGGGNAGARCGASEAPLTGHSGVGADAFHEAFADTPRFAVDSPMNALAGAVAKTPREPGQDTPEMAPCPDHARHAPAYHDHHHAAGGATPGVAQAANGADTRTGAGSDAGAGAGAIAGTVAAKRTNGADPGPGSHSARTHSHQTRRASFDPDEPDRDFTGEHVDFLPPRKRREQLQGWEVGDRYSLTKLLGHGAYGEVALATDLETNTKVWNTLAALPPPLAMHHP